MKIWKNNVSTVYKIISLENCCDKILRNPVINLFVSENNFEPIVSISEHKPTYDYGDGYTEVIHHKITHCPFCGEVINISVESVENVAEECNKIQEETNNLYYLYNNCDSKQEENRLREKMRELIKKLDWYSESDIWEINLEGEKYEDNCN